MKFGAGPLETRQERICSKRFVILIVSFLFFSTFGPEVFWLQTAEAASAPAARVKPTQKKRAPQRSANNRSPSARKAMRGTASWYGPHFDGKKTASGEIFDQEKLTAAHKTLPLGSKALITNLQNGNSVEVEINDRGPYVGERVIDVSYAAARELGLIEAGVAPVRIELVEETS